MGSASHMPEAGSVKHGCLRWLEVLFVLAVGVERHGECGLHLALSNGTSLDGSAFLSAMLAFSFHAVYGVRHLSTSACLHLFSRPPLNNLP